jgi:hypothetical protein
LFVSCEEEDLSDGAFIDFARDIAREINAENEIPIVNAFDYDEFERRVLAGVDISSREKELASAFIRENSNPARTFLELVMNGGDFRFVRFYRKGREPHLIFRTYFNGGVSLEDWVLGVKDGRILIYDAFAIVSGINWSDDCRQKLCNYLELYTEEVMNINRLIDVNYLMSNETYHTADSLLYWLMPQMQDNMYARTIEMNLASLSKSYEVMQSLANKFIKTFPAEQRIAVFYLMQSSIQHALVDETLKHIYVLIDLLGDDPLYYLYQSWACQQANEHHCAMQTLDSVIRYMPHVFDLYLNKLDLYYSDYNYQECVRLLYRMDSLFLPDDEEVLFFKTNYPRLDEYRPFTEWLATKKEIKEKIYN